MSEKKAILLLDEHLINKIAAGEVVEDASSVIKELVENAIDAGATSVEVVTKGGGRSLIIVSDNGCGIKKEELPMALCRHATSKIQQIDDLFALETFGFRGEALASIASVSKCMILSAVSGNVGYKLSSEGGKIIDCSIQPRQTGTTIEVRDLFYNVPVRKKFQKSVQSSIREIHKVLMQAAFAFPKVSFRWIDDDKQEFFLSSDRDLMTTIATFLGSEWHGNLFDIEETMASYRLSGMLSLPHFSKGNRSGQYLFVNDRPIFSALISNAVLEAYGTRLTPGRHPHFVLFLSVPAHKIDVNVHPQKKEIRFQEDKEISRFVLESIQKSLEKRYEPISFAPQELEALPPMAFTSAPLSFSSTEKTLKIEKNENVLLATFTLLAVVDQFLLIEREKKHYLIDALGAQKRILFEKIEKTESSLSVQALLFPLTLELSPLQNKIYERNLSLFQKLKIEMRPLGAGFYIIDALADGIDEEKIYDLLEALSEEREEKKVAFSLNHLIKRKALTFHEAYKLVETLFLCSDFSKCPEGRPTIIPWPKEELQRLFQ